MKASLSNFFNLKAKRLLLGVICGLALTCSLQAQVSAATHKNEDPVIEALSTSISAKDLLNIEQVLVLKNQTITPLGNGNLTKHKVELPAYTRGVYYRPYTEFFGNRVAPIWFKDISDIVQFKPELPRDLRDKNNVFDPQNPNFSIDYGSYLALELSGGKHLAILPLVGPNSSTSFMLENGELLLVTSTYGNKAFSGNVPVFTSAIADTPYEASQKAWEKALRVPEIAKMTALRTDKKYPELFKYLGWASWEAYLTEIDEQVIVNAFKTINDSDMPIRWFLVDDGYLDEKDRQLLSFGVNTDKFPNGWDPLIKLRNEKIKWFGIWRNMGGYMNGVSHEHTMRSLDEHLFDAGDYLIPKPTVEANKAFFDLMAKDSADNGFDFHKVDFQSFHFEHYHGLDGVNAVEAARLSHEGLENASHENLDGLLNCIAQVNVNVFNTKFSSVMRNSVDYKDEREKSNYITVQSFANALWMSPVLWGDMDGYFTHHTEMAKRLAVSRAISGGPFYLFDVPEKMDTTWVMPAIYQDGEVIGTLAPGVATPDSIYNDPFEGSAPYRAIAPLSNASIAVQVMNMTEDHATVKGYISKADYSYGSSLLEEAEKVAFEQNNELYAFDFYAQSGQVLNKSGIIFDLAKDDDKLFVVVPVRYERALIGLHEKYMSPQTFSVLAENDLSVTIQVNESGSFMLWSPSHIPKSADLTFTPKPGGLWVTQVKGNKAKNDINIEFNKR